MSTQAEFLTLKSNCQASLAVATNQEKYRQWFIQSLKQFSDNQNNAENEDNEDITLLDDSYIELEFILYGGLMCQSR